LFVLQQLLIPLDNTIKKGEAKKIID